MWGAIPGLAGGQHLFGSIDDPSELPRPAWWMRTTFVEPAAGLSLVGAQWRSAARLRAHFESRSASGEFDGSLRAGIYGRYEPDADEAYDLVRSIRHLRINTPGAYARIGTPTRTRFGEGLLVDFYNGTAVWDERTAGLELALSGSRFSLSAMASDVRMDRIVGGRVEFRPLGAAGRGLRLGAELVTDRRFERDAANTPTARSVDIRLTAARSGGFRLEPFAAAGELLRYGRGISVGADLENDNFIDLARFHARLSLSYAEARFIPGYFGSFYEVHNPQAEIAAGEGIGEVAGVPLRSAAAGTYLGSELRILFFERFEFWYAFRRHFGDQALSTFHVRLFIRSERLLFSFAEDRGGLRNFFSLFNDVGDESIMSFRAEYRLRGPIWLRVDARYGYIPLLEIDGRTRYAVQRRFEPFMGLRLEF